MMTTQTLLVLPGGGVPEGQFGLIMLDLLNSGHRDLTLYGNLLARIQTGVSPASLVREEGGWRGDRLNSVRYAMAVLEFAERAGHTEAATHWLALLPLLPKPQD